MSELVLVDYAVPLTGTLDLDAMLPRYPKTDSIKGMFFGRFSETLGDLGRFADQLSSPPRFGRYVPFTDYPLRDYMFLVNRSVEKRYAALGLREGLRRLARDDLAIFGQSVLGRVMVEVAGSAHPALLATPKAFAAVAKGGLVLSARSLGPTRVEMTFAGVYGAWEYNVGQLEGIVGFFGARCRCRITPHRPEHPTLIIEVELCLGGNTTGR